MKRLIKLLLIFCISMCCASVYAAESPTLIYTEADFWAIADNPDGNYELANNITISSDQDIFDFSGRFDGNGYTIEMSKQGDSRNMSLFRNLTGAHIIDIRITGYIKNQIFTEGDICAFVAAVSDENSLVEMIECSASCRYRPDLIEVAAIVGINKGTIRNSVNRTDYETSVINEGEIINCVSQKLSFYEIFQILYSSGLPKDREYIIYREPLRSDRIEAVSFKTKSGFYTDVKWEPVYGANGNSGKLYVDENEYTDPIRYYYNDGQWFEFEDENDIISDTASEILTSTLNVAEHKTVHYGTKHLVPKHKLASTTADTVSFIDAVTVQMDDSSILTQNGNPYLSAPYSVAISAAMTQFATYAINGEWVGGMELTSETIDGKTTYGFKNKDGIQVIPNEYLFIEPFYHDTARAKNSKYKWGVIDKQGNVIVDFKYELRWPRFYAHGEFFCGDEYGSLGPEYDGEFHSTGGFKVSADKRYEREFTTRADDGSTIIVLNDYLLYFHNGRASTNGKYLIDRRYVDVYVNGKYIFSEAPACIIGGSTMIPVRALCEALGCSVSYNSSNAEVHISKDSKDIYLNIGWETMRCTNSGGDEIIALDVPPMIVSSRTLAPLRAVSEALGFEVEWDAVLNRVNIH